MGLYSMRYALVVAVLLVGFSGYAFLSVQAQDQAAPQAVATGEVQGLKISVVDIDKILSASKAAKTLKAQAEKSLRESQKAIEKESKTLSKEDLMKKAQEFEAKRLEARKAIQDKKSKLDAAYTEAMNSLTQKIYEVCQKIADEQKIDLVITRQNIIVGSMALDITDAVLKGLDDALPSVELKVK